MKKNFIKMNNSDNQLSLGNFCRIVKSLAQNKGFANQTEVFYTIFGVDNVSDSTINNYCIGYRCIGSEFRQIYIKRKKQFEIDNSIFDETILGLMSILDGEIYLKTTHQYVLEKLKTHSLANKLILYMYNIAKNDKSVSDEFTKKLSKKIDADYKYEALCDILLYIVLEKKQPIYIETSQKEIIEGILNKTNISVSELEKFLKLQMQDGINYTHSLKNLAKENNPYACFELGEMEYNGQMTGAARYVKAYDYLKIAASKNHPRACWLIAQMFYQKKLGNLTTDDKMTAFNYLNQAISVGSVAALNSLGIAYLKGLVPNEEASEDKAIEYFKKAMDSDYVYAYNNLGMIYEKKNDYKKAYECYYFSASKGESWACNKIGEFYRLGIYVDKDYKKAYEYYKLSIDVPISLLDPWAYYNLGKYFYLTGCPYASLEKDVDMALKCFEKAYSKGLIIALKELIYIYIDKYAKERLDIYFDKINKYLEILSSDNSYDDFRNDILDKLKMLEIKHLAIVKY